MTGYKSNYPVDMDECTKIATWGGCGLECHIFQAGKCEYEEEVRKGNTK